MPSKKKKKHAFEDDTLIVLFRNTAVIITYCIIVIYMIVNIVVSQYMPGIFYDLINGKKEAIIQLFIHSNDLAQFEDLLPEVKNVLAQHSDEVYKESNNRKIQINSLLSLLESNPKSPEILYSLHLLYQAEKDAERANMYLQQARIIDPQIGLKKAY